MLFKNYFTLQGLLFQMFKVHVLPIVPCEQVMKSFWSTQVWDLSQGGVVENLCVSPFEADTKQHLYAYYQVPVKQCLTASSLISCVVGMKNVFPSARKISNHINSVRQTTNSNHGN